MYQYKYVRITVQSQGYGLINGTSYGIGEYRQIIDSCAASGWHYVGYIPVEQRGTGHIEEMDLIFEKEIYKHLRNNEG